MTKSSDVSAGQQATAAQHNALREDAIRLLASAIQARTLATGAFTIVDGKARYELTSESGTADDLVTITAGTGAPDDGDMIIIYPASTHVITIKHNTGNIYNAAEDDVQLQPFQYTILVFDTGDSKWYIAGGAGAGTDFLIAQIFS